MNGPRLKPIEASRLYNKIIAFIKNRRQHPILKAYKTKSFGIRHQVVFDDTQKWCKEFPLFIKDEDDFTKIVNDISDCQSLSILDALSNYEKEIYIPCVGCIYIKDVTHDILRQHDFNAKDVLALKGFEYSNLKRAFYDRVKSDRFLKCKDKAKYYESRTARFADILRRRET